MKHEHLHITGVVQGVGMRPFVYREAVACKVSGWACNAGDGVHIEAHASAASLDRFAAALQEHAPSAARIDAIKRTPLPAGDLCAQDLRGFRIIASDDTVARTTLVSPDIATCPDCLRELFDARDRRYHYPFINCTNCGPRFTIIRSLPYDRAATAMSAFKMCPDCDREYRDPLDRRFHAQPDACFACGPHITWRERGDCGRIRQGATQTESDAIIARCAEVLADGKIVAIKGLGGFHLACNAQDDRAVRNLRQRKHRSNKPFAVMVGDLRDARALCRINDTERALLEGPTRPIVLLRRRYSASVKMSLAPAVAFDLPEIGVMLPYTPLQHLLLDACRNLGITRLVMTSGNVSDEPIETDDEQAWQRLSPIAEALLGNDRAILSRFDDSVMRVVNSLALPVRRARGYAPQPLELPPIPSVSNSSDADAVSLCRTAGPIAKGARAITPILACGPEQKATLAFTREQTDGTALCFMSQHIGDLENAATFSAWHDARTRMEALFDLHPQALAADMHPAYLSSQWARQEAQKAGFALITVQHHHAHIASVIADAAARGAHHASEAVIGLAFDGTGAGPDHSVWGGEVLIADLFDYSRIGCLQPWRLPGGGASVRDARRCAFSLLSSHGLLQHPGAHMLLESLSEQERAITASMVERGINSPLTSSMGRLFDAVSALLGICSTATYEGEPAVKLEAAAWRYLQTAQASKDNALPRAHDILKPWRAADALRKNPAFRDRKSACGQQEFQTPAFTMDTGELLATLLAGLKNNTAPEQLAYAFHLAIADLASAAVTDAKQRTGINTVALSGGVFMNRLLLQTVVRQLEEQGFVVLVPRNVPVNDGCIAYGQAAIARMRLAAPCTQDR